MYIVGALLPQHSLDIHDNNNNDDNNDDDDDTTSFTLTAQVGLSSICEVGRDIQKSSQHVAR